MTWNLILPPLSNVFGFLALILYFLTLQPGMLRVINPDLIHNRFILFVTKNRRVIGISAFVLGLLHGVLMIQKKDLDLMDINSYLKYWPGFTLLLIFTILASTSNQWSVSHLKQNWKKLHQITFLIMFVSLIHVVDKVEIWTILTPLVITILTVSIAEFTWRKMAEMDKKISKTNSN
jgi:sulfoxide reductase heme-binding subunit YedZ